MRNVLKVLIADDHPMIREGMTQMLRFRSDYFLHITEVADGEEVIRETSKGKFDVIFMDIRMPKLDGLSAFRKLRQKGNTTPVILISVFEDENIVRIALECGVNGFLQKTCGAEEMVKSIDTVLSGGKYYCSEISQIALGTSRGSSRLIGGDIKLTKREIQVMKLLSEEVPCKEISDLLGVSAKTIEWHRENLKIKLGVKSTIGIARFAFSNRHLFRNVVP